MQKKTIWAIVIVVLIAAAIGGYLAFGNSDSKTETPSSQTASNTSNTNTSTAATPVNNAIIITKTDSSFGQYLADPSGKTLYFYGADTANTSNCSGSCLTAWPAYIATDSTGLPADISVVNRSDGTKQYAYKTKPLYYFQSDSSAGQVTGNHVGGFIVATP